MSNPTKTVLWTGKFVQLVKHSGYTSYTMGSHNYTSGHVDIEFLSRIDGYSTRLHESATAPSDQEKADWTKRNITWGRLTPVITAKLIERAQAIDAGVPAKREAAKAAHEAQVKAEAEAKAKIKAEWDARVEKAVRLRTLIESQLLVGPGVTTESMELAGLASTLLNYTACGGPCGRKLPRSFFGYGCGAHGGCSEVVCHDCNNDSTDEDGFRIAFPESTLVCAKHSAEIRLRLKTAKLANQKKG